MQTFLQDLRYGIRLLRKTPGFSTIAVLTLALGIGANTVIFSVVQGMSFQSLPVKNPGQLVVVLQHTGLWTLPLGLSYPDYLDYRDKCPVFSDVIAYQPIAAHISDPGRRPERTWIELVSGNYFSMLGESTAVGRVFLPKEGNDPSATPAMVLSYQYWQRRYGADPAVVGRIVTLDGRPCTIIGVTPERFHGTEFSIAVSAYIPIESTGRLIGYDKGYIDNRALPTLRLLGQTKPGVTFAQARASVEAIANQLAKEYPKEHKERSVFVVPETRARPDPVFTDIMPMISAAMLGVAWLVLLIACANVANLMFSHALARQKEMSVRAALGASRFRLIRQMLTESIVLAFLAGVMAIILAYWTKDLLFALVPPSDIPIRTDHGWNWTTFVFTIFLALLSGLITGLVPAWKASKHDLVGSLKDRSAGAMGSSRHMFRSLLVVGQVAISLLLLICCSLFIKSLSRIHNIDFGFQAHGLLMASMDLGMQGYDDTKGMQFLNRLLDRVKTLPGVESVGLAQNVPFGYTIRFSDILPADQSSSTSGDPDTIPTNEVSPDYFRTMKIPLLEGRAFTQNDNNSSPPVAIVNQMLARRFWPGQSPLNKRFRLGREGPFVTVVGVVRNGKYVMLAEDPRPYLFLPLAQNYTSPVVLQIRTVSSPVTYVPAVREILQELDRDLPIFNVNTMEKHMNESGLALMPFRLGATIAGVQGILGLSLAVMGIYAVVAYAVGRRTQEIGVRMALGASSLGVLKLIVSQGMILIFIGIGLGLSAAFVMTRLLARLLFDVKPTDIAIFASVTTLVMGIGLLACYLPARRATKVDPIEALRYE